MNNYERQKRYIENQKKKGFILWRVWIKPEWKESIKKLIKELA